MQIKKSVQSNPARNYKSQVLNQGASDSKANTFSTHKILRLDHGVARRAPGTNSVCH